MQLNFRLSLLLAVLSLGGTLLTYGQKHSKTDDYIVTLQGDTLKGQIKAEKEQKIKFKPINGDSFSSYTSADITSYYINKDSMLYVPIAIKSGKKPIFLWAKERGKIDFLIHLQAARNVPVPVPMAYSGGTTMMGGFFFKTKTQYIRKEDGELIRLKKKRAVLTDLMADAPEIISDINAESKFNEKTIAKYIHLYNQQ